MCVVIFQSYGEFVGGSISDEQRKTVLHNACPGAGACGGMYTANTMASAIEAMGMSLPYRLALQTLVTIHSSRLNNLRGSFNFYS